MFLTCFRQFHFLTQTKSFAWAIAFALWPFLDIFKMVSFFEYKCFFQAVFRLEQLLCVCRGDFGMFQAILFFDPNLVFCMGYSLCIVPFFQIFKMVSFFEC